MIVRIAGAQDRARWLIHATGRVVDERLANGGDQRFVGENGANFILRNVHDVISKAGMQLQFGRPP